MPSLGAILVFVGFLTLVYVQNEFSFFLIFKAFGRGLVDEVSGSLSADSAEQAIQFWKIAKKHGKNRNRGLTGCWPRECFFLTTSFREDWALWVGF